MEKKKERRTGKERRLEEDRRKSNNLNYSSVKGTVLLTIFSQKYKMR